MFNDKDFMGGMFDFDGNGKTTLDEQYVAYKIYEETTKEENDSSLSYHKPAKEGSHGTIHTRTIERPACGACDDAGTACGADAPLQVCVGQL